MPSRNRNQKKIKSYSELLKAPPPDWASDLRSEAQRELARDLKEEMLRRYTQFPTPTLSTETITADAAQYWGPLINLT